MALEDRAKELEHVGGRFAKAWAKESVAEETVAIETLAEVNADYKQPPIRVELEIALAEDLARLEVASLSLEEAVAVGMPTSPWEPAQKFELAF